MRPLRCAPASALLLTLAATLPAAAQISPAVERWSAIGPKGGTITALAVAPTSRRTLYAGTDRGLIFRSTDGGTTWTLSRDWLDGFSPDAVISDLVVDPRDSAVVYASADTQTYPQPFLCGAAVKSTDGGRSWVPIPDGLFGCHVMDLALDPHDPDLRAGLYRLSQTVP